MDQQFDNMEEMIENSKNEYDLLKTIAQLLKLKINGSNLFDLYKNHFVGISMQNSTCFGIIVEDLGHAIIVDEYSISIDINTEVTSIIKMNIYNVKRITETTYIPKASIVKIAKSGFLLSEVTTFLDKHIIKKYPDK